MKERRTNTTQNSQPYSKLRPQFVGAGVLALLFVPAAYVGLPALFATTYNAVEPGSIASSTPEQPELEIAAHIPTPDSVRAIYMSQCVAGTPSFRDKLVTLIEETELNSVIIDIKDYTGTIGFPTRDPRFEAVTLTECGARDMREFIERLHAKDIYVIGRITVFQDPTYTRLHPEQSVQSKSRPGEPWVDHKGLSFVSVEAKPFWDYIIELSKESYAIGFDELNFDYIRWPSDGDMSDVDYPAGNKAEALEKFFAYLHDALEDTGVVTSADLFGYTTTHTDHLGIGQVLERALPYFDYVAPMVYPSHYNSGFAGLKNPNSDPYKVIHVSMAEAVRRAQASQTPVETLNNKPIYEDEIVPAYTNASGEFVATSTKRVASGLYTKPVYSPDKLRPWLQDFDYGGDYGPEEVRAQIQATYDVGLDSWMLWDPGNTYTRAALQEASPGSSVEEDN